MSGFTNSTHERFLISTNLIQGLTASSRAFTYGRLNYRSFIERDK